MSDQYRGADEVPPFLPDGTVNPEWPRTYREISEDARRRGYMPSYMFDQLTEHLARTHGYKFGPHDDPHEAPYAVATLHRQLHGAKR